MPTTIVTPPGAGLVGGSNYTFADSCNALTGLVVTFSFTQDLVTNNGFGLQLNAHTKRHRQPWVGSSSVSASTPAASCREPSTFGTPATP